MCSRIEILEKLKDEKKPAVKRLVLSLMKYDIVYKEKDGNLDNVVFSRGSKTFKCAYEMFFRYSGRCVYKGADNETKPLTDDMFYDWLKMFILVKLGIDKI